MAATTFSDEKFQRECHSSIDVEKAQPNPTTKILGITKEAHIHILVDLFWYSLTLIIIRTAQDLYRAEPAPNFWPIASSPSTVWAVTPLLAYPFLPPGGLFVIPREVCLIWPAGLGITHLYGSLLLNWLYNEASLWASTPWQFWQLPLMWFTILVSFDMLALRRRDDPDGKLEFPALSATAWVWLICPILPFVHRLRNDGDRPSFLLVVLVLLVSSVAVAWVVTIIQRHIIRPALSYDTSRRAEDGVDGGFKRTGSKILAGWMLAMPFVLAMLMGLWPSAPVLGSESVGGMGT